MNAINQKHIENLEQTQQFATQLANGLRPGEGVLLFGDVGAGKTTFAQALIRAWLGSDILVNSPTFTLMQPYTREYMGEVQTLWHLDLYRVESERELAELGLEELLERENLVIEWAEKCPPRWWPASRLMLKISPQENGSRLFTWKAFGAFAERAFHVAS